MESWTSAVAYWPTTKQDDFVSKYGTGDHGALDASSQNFATFTSDWKLGIQFYDPGQFSASAASGLLNNNWGYFMFIELQGGGVSHARLAYDVADANLRAMEPATTGSDYIVGPASGLKKIMILSPAITNT